MKKIMNNAMKMILFLAKRAFCSWWNHLLPMYIECINKYIGKYLSMFVSIHGYMELSVYLWIYKSICMYVCINTCMYSACKPTSVEASLKTFAWFSWGESSKSKKTYPKLSDKSLCSAYC